MPSFLIFAEKCQQDPYGRVDRARITLLFDGTREEMVTHLRTLDIAEGKSAARALGNGTAPIVIEREERWLEIERIVEVAAIVDPLPILDDEHRLHREKAIQDHLDEQELAILLDLEQKGFRIGPANPTPDPEEPAFGLTVEEMGDPRLQDAKPRGGLMWGRFTIKDEVASQFRIDLDRSNGTWSAATAESFVVDPSSGLRIPLAGLVPGETVCQAEGGERYSSLTLGIDACGPGGDKAAIRILLRDDGTVFLDIRTEGGAGFGWSRGRWTLPDCNGLADAIAHIVWRRVNGLTRDYIGTMACVVDELERDLKGVPRTAPIIVDLGNRTEYGMSVSAGCTLYVGDVLDAFRPLRSVILDNDQEDQVWSRLIRSATTAATWDALLSGGVNCAYEPGYEATVMVGGQERCLASGSIVADMDED